MPKTVLALAVIAILSTSVLANESELDTDLMQSIEDTNKSLSSNIALKDAKAAVSDSKELNSMFDKVQIFFEHKGGADDAVELAKKTKGLTNDIVSQIGQGDFDAATNSATTLSRTCRTCHTFYKKE
ncbi:MAG TPA: hypothetical protein VIF60_07225 [Burkholderiaceae bacterium]|jgi:hypothetical protein